MKDYYTNLRLLDDGQFKNNNHILKFGIKEVDTIYDHMESSNNALSKITDLSVATISRIKQAIKKGYFDEYLSIPKQDPDVSYMVDYSTDKTITNAEPVKCNCNHQEHSDNDYNKESDTINIHDIHINIYNNNDVKQEESVEQGIKINQMRLKQWSKKIRERGHYICAKCGKIDEDHCQAHHIYGKASHPQLACDEGNGIVLCQKCHSDYHKKFTGETVNPYTFIGWLNE